MRIDVERLRELAGEKTFQRGQAYHEDGHVTLTTVGRSRVVAVVEGTDDYHTVIELHGKTIGGECSCPAFEDRGVCKHMVATALAAKEAPQSTTDTGMSTRIGAYLQTMTKDALIGMIQSLAEVDLALLRKLDIASAGASGDGAEAGRQLKKAVERATRVKGFVDYRDARAWARDIRAALDAVSTLAEGPHASVAMDVMDYAIVRIEAAAGSIDDSDGHIGGLLEHARDIHLQAARAARPDPVKLARELFTRETKGDFDTFYGASELYAGVLGKKGSAEYKRLARAAWDKLPVQSGKFRRKSENFYDYHRLRNILDHYAEREKDVETRIALRSKDLSSQFAYVELAEFCQAMGRTAEALKHAEEGLWLFEDDPPDSRLVSLTATLLEKAGRREEADALLWRVFEKSLDETLYETLRKRGGAAAADRAIKYLKGTNKTQNRLGNATSSILLVRILMREKRFDEAWELVRPMSHGWLTFELAEASEKTHTQDALATYAARVESLIAGSGYGEAVKLVRRMAKLQPRAEHDAFVAALKERHHRKRKLLELLK